jgi:hypothetical protein
MTRPQLLFAFGRHPGNTGGGDRKFFSENIIPFTEGVMRQGGTVAIIHPACLADHVPLGSKQKEALAAPESGMSDSQRAAGMGFVRDYLRGLEGFWAGELRRNGIAAYSWTGHGMGYENELEARLHGAGHPGRLLHLIEPQSDIVAVLKWDMGRRYREWCAAPEDAAACREYVKALTWYLIARDRLVQQEADAIAEKHEGVSVIIPRERVHLPMVRLFDGERFETRLRECEHRTNDGVFSAVVINFYSGQVDDRGLELEAGRVLLDSGPPPSAAAARF